MASTVSVGYGNSIIINTSTGGTWTLKTSGKVMSDDVDITYTKDSFEGTYVKYSEITSNYIDSSTCDIDFQTVCPGIAYSLYEDHILLMPTRFPFDSFTALSTISPTFTYIYDSDKALMTITTSTTKMIEDDPPIFDIYVVTTTTDITVGPTAVPIGSNQDVFPNDSSIGMSSMTVEAAGYDQPTITWNGSTATATANGLSASTALSNPTITVNDTDGGYTISHYDLNLSTAFDITAPFISSNIKEGKNILGLDGTAQGSGSITSAYGSTTVTGSSVTGCTITHGLDGTPNLVIVTVHDPVLAQHNYYACLYNGSRYLLYKGGTSYSNATYIVTQTSGIITVDTTTITVSYYSTSYKAWSSSSSSSATFEWFAAIV